MILSLNILFNNKIVQLSTNKNSTTVKKKKTLISNYLNSQQKAHNIKN